MMIRVLVLLLKKSLRVYIIYFNIDQTYQRELLSKRNGKEENDPNSHSDQGTPRGITRRVPPTGIQIKERWGKTLQ